MGYGSFAVICPVSYLLTGLTEVLAAGGSVRALAGVRAGPEPAFIRGRRVRGAPEGCPGGGLGRKSAQVRHDGQRGADREGDGVCRLPNRLVITLGHGPGTEISREFQLRSVRQEDGWSVIRNGYAC
jgi:hypothetical protein